MLGSYMVFAFFSALICMADTQQSTDSPFKEHSLRIRHVGVRYPWNDKKRLRHCWYLACRDYREQVIV